MRPYGIRPVVELPTVTTRYLVATGSDVAQSTSYEKWAVCVFHVAPFCIPRRKKKGMKLERRRVCQVFENCSAPEFLLYPAYRKPAACEHANDAASAPVVHRIRYFSVAQLTRVT